MDLDLHIMDYVTKSIIIVPVIVAIVQAVKMSKLPENYAPIVAVITGVLIAFLTDSGITWGQNVLAGLIYGLSASGLYSGTKAISQSKSKAAKKGDK